ncbi:hypothetical protein ISCGN_029720 [Ixodes scapularis]
MVKEEHLIADMVKRRVDILFYNIVPDANRWRLLHFPRFFDHGRVLFYTVRKPSLRAGAFIREAPMAFFTILFLSMVTCALGFCLINYCSGRGLVNGIQDVVFVLVSTAMLFSYPVPERFQRVLAGRIVLFCWMAGGFSLAVYFQSLLTSSLSSGYVWEADDTIEKLYSRLASKKVLPCVLKGSYYDRLLRQSDDKHGIIGAMAAARRLSSNKASTVSYTTKDCMEKVLGGSHVFISHEKHQCFLAKHGNRLTSGKDTIYGVYASTPVRKDWPLRNSYGQLVARMFETGLLSNRMSLRYWNCSRIRDMQVSLAPYDASQIEHGASAPPPPPEEERQFLVFESCLRELFKTCQECSRLCQTTIETTGTRITVYSICPVEHVRTWKSQPIVNGRPAGNILLTSHLVFSGVKIAPTLRMLRHMNVQVISNSSFYEHRKAFALPAIHKAMASVNMEKEGLLKQLQFFKEKGSRDPPPRSRDLPDVVIVTDDVTGIRIVIVITTDDVISDVTDDLTGIRIVIITDDVISDVTDDVTGIRIVIITDDVISDLTDDVTDIRIVFVIIADDVEVVLSYRQIPPWPPAPAGKWKEWAPPCCEREWRLVPPEASGQDDAASSWYVEVLARPPGSGNPQEPRWELGG